MDIYQHFRKEEHPFIDQVISWKDEVERTYQPKLSDFLDPREQDIFAAIIGNNSDFTWKSFGGDERMERKRIMLAPYYEQIDQEAFKVSLLEASFPQKFITISHKDVLGAFMSSGVKRKKLGDLIIDDGIIQIIVAAEIEMYIKMNLTTIKKATVSFERKAFSSLLEKNETWETHETTVSSLRLDVFIKEVYRISRQQAGNYIQKGFAKVNHQIIDNPSFLLERNDLVSLRGKGRSKLNEINGLSKKEKWKITFQTLK